MVTKNSKFLSLFFLSFSFLTGISSSLAIEGIQTTIIEPVQAQKVLQQEALCQIDIILRYLHQIGLRLNTLKLTKEDKADVTGTILFIKDALETLKIKYALHITEFQLTQLINFLKSFTDYIEKALISSFTKIPELDAAAIKRSQPTTALTLKEIEKELTDNNTRLYKFNDLITNLNLSWFQKKYRTLSDVWQSPLYTFNCFGGSNLYMSSILKRVIVYPTALSLIVYNLDKETIKETPFKPLKSVLLKIKDWVGSVPQKVLDQKIVEGGQKNPIDLIGHSEALSTEIKNPVTRQYERTVPEGSGALNLVQNSINWATNLDTNLKFTIPFATYLGSFIYEDLKSAGASLPVLRSYLHNKFRGESDNSNLGTIQSYDQTFDDVVGRDAIKASLQPMIDFIKDPNGYIQSGIQLPRGYMLTGEPQTGKTSMVKALSGELTKALKSVGRNEEVGIFNINVSLIKEHTLEFWIRVAKQHAPCIIFCDEFDLLQAKRDKESIVLSDVLQALSGYHSSSDLREFVCFMIATNCPEDIDFAVKDPARCGNILYFENPNLYDRKEYFTQFFKKKLISTNNIDIDALAQETEACSYGTLIEVANSSLRFAEKNHEMPEQKHVDKALDKTVRKIIEENADISEEYKQTIACRYGSQAFTSLLINSVKKLTSVTTYKITKNPTANNSNERTGHSGVQIGGIFFNNVCDTYDIMTDSGLIKEIKVTVSGSIGQKVLGLDAVHFIEDEIKALKIAHKIVFKGIDEKMLPESIREAKKLEAYNLVQECKEVVRELLESKKEELIKVTDLLQKRRTLRTSDIKNCLGLDNLELIDYFSSQEK